jgi:hypothetical protein
MTVIEMNIDRARSVHYELGVAIDYLIADRKLLLGIAEGLPACWQSGSAAEFAGLHQVQMNVLWEKLQALIRLRMDLNAAIQIAEQAQEHLSGG